MFKNVIALIFACIMIVMGSCDDSFIDPDGVTCHHVCAPYRGCLEVYKSLSECAEYSNDLCECVLKNPLVVS